jgi:hypothetical protein
MRIIEVHTCGECPYMFYSDGRGHCGEFVRCDKFSFLIYDSDGPESFDVNSGIHPECKLNEFNYKKM